MPPLYDIPPSAPGPLPPRPVNPAMLPSGPYVFGDRESLPVQPQGPSMVGGVPYSPGFGMQSPTPITPEQQAMWQRRWGGNRDVQGPVQRLGNPFPPRPQGPSMVGGTPYSPQLSPQFALFRFLQQLISQMPRQSFSQPRLY